MRLAAWSSWGPCWAGGRGHGRGNDIRQGHVNDCSLEFLHTICLPRGLCHCPTLHGRVRSNECWPEGSKATNAGTRGI